MNRRPAFRLRQHDHEPQQEQINAYFHTQASFWKDVYADDDLFSQIHRERHVRALDWIDGLGLAPGAAVLEIGCGAGFLSVALAKRGFEVHAIDSVEAMVAQARQHVAELGIGDSLAIALGDANELRFADGSFDLVVALGVIPWLEDPRRAIEEMARATRPGGYVLITDDNQARLNVWLDPWLDPGVTWLKRRAKAALVRLKLYHLSASERGSTLHLRRFVDTALRRAGLNKLRSVTLGFGPFTFFRWHLLSKPRGVALHHQLQRLADRNVPLLRSTGAQYLVLARKVKSPVLSPALPRPTDTWDSAKQL